jgi:hypothetical protein
MDPCSILENRKKIGEQSGVVCAGGGGQLQALRCESPHNRENDQGKNKSEG